jgi:cytidyltransferase-like protein
MSHRWPLVVACGKFQPFHVEHLEYVLKAFEFGEHVVIGITNPDPMHIREEETDPRRSTREANPFTYYERYLMVRDSLRDADINCLRYDIVPFPINVPEVWFNYVPQNAVFLLTLYEDDQWLKVRKAKLEAAGLKTEVLWSKPNKGITGAEVRQKIRAGHEWDEHLPPAVARIIRECGLEPKLHEIEPDRIK